MPASSSHLTGVKSAFIYAVWSGSWDWCLPKGLWNVTSAGIHFAFGKSAPNELSFRAGSAEHFRHGASNTLQLFPVLAAGDDCKKGAASWWSLKRSSRDRGQLHRAVHTGHWLAVSRYFPVPEPGKVGEEGKELELGSLFWVAKIESHTMEISGFTWGKGWTPTPSCAICSLFEWTKGSLPRLIAYLPGCPNVTRCFHKPHPQNNTCS